MEEPVEVPLLSAGPRPRGRWLWWLLLPLCVFTWLVVRRQAMPLQMVAWRTVPREWWLNCSVLTHVPVQQLHYLNDDDRGAIWLAADGRALDRTGITVSRDAAISPDGAVIVNLVAAKPAAPGDHDYRITLDGRDGTHREIAPSPLKRVQAVKGARVSSVSAVTDDGAFSDRFGGVFLNDGSPVALPHDGRRYEIAATACNDPRFLPLLGVRPSTTGKPANGDMQFLLLDRARQQPAFTCSWQPPRSTASIPPADPNLPVVVFHDGNRFVCAGGRLARVFEGNKLLATFEGDWQWCGDGSLWRSAVAADHPELRWQFLHWRMGKPDLLTVPVPSAAAVAGEPSWGEHSALSRGRFLGPPTAWGDGALIARAESVTPQADPLLAALHLAPPPVRTVQLALYRHGALIGAHFLESTPSPIITTRLAFAPDGRTLYWIYQHDDGMRLCVFRVRR